MTQSERERMRRGENQRKETKERTQRSIRHRGLRLEALEERQLLAVTSVGVFSPEWMGDLPVATATDSVDIPVDVVISERDVVAGDVDFSPAPTTSIPNPTSATWTVVSDSDSASDYGSLRYILANAASGDSIYFSSSLSGSHLCCPSPTI